MWRDAGKQRGATFRTKSEAMDFEAEQRRLKLMGAFAPAKPSSTTIEQWFNKWMNDYGVAWASTTMVQRRNVVVKWIIPMVGHVPLTDFGRTRVREWRADVARKCSAVHTNGITAVMSAGLGAAVEEGMIPYNPVSGMKRMRHERPARRAHSMDTLQAIMDAMPTPRDRLRTAIMGYAGLRPAEASGLMWDDVRSDVLIVQRSVQNGKTQPTKTGTSRQVPIFPPLAAQLALADHCKGKWVTPGERGGPLNHRMWARRVWSPVVNSLGLDITPYELRHGFASWALVEQRIDPVTVANWMGHSVRVLYDVYSHLIVHLPSDVTA